jgi:hypothetical protein
MYLYFPIWNYTILKKRRGRKKELENSNVNKHLKEGSIIAVENKTDIRGVMLKKKKKESKTYFLNSITIVMLLKMRKL